MAVLNDGNALTGLAGFCRTATPCSNTPGCVQQLPRLGVTVRNGALLHAATKNVGHGTRLMLGEAGRDDTEGNPAPCLKVARYGGFPVRLRVRTGDRTLTVEVKQPEATAERPFVKVRANADIGLTTAQTATADATTGWQTLTIEFTATADGGVWVELWNADPGKPCWFDKLNLT